jgi:hypothetical protein
MKYLYLLIAFLPSLTFAEPLPKQWHVVTNGEYKAGIEISKNKTKAAFIKSGNVGNDSYSIITQSISCKNYSDNIKISADLKTEYVSERAGIFVKVDGANEIWIDNFKTRPIQGTKDWQRHFSVVPIPENCEQITFGFILVGGGSVWADNFSIESSTEDPTTDYKQPGRIDNPENLNFDKKSHINPHIKRTQ